ncbi:site-2 protease family protein [bacterium]|nr:site-2 protease family protein [bacterium]
MFILTLLSDPRFYIFWITISIFSTCIHEFAHAITAYWQGDDTAKLMGRFTLNPMVHMGKVSLLCLLFFGLCWGLCPVNPNKLKHSYSDAVVSFAGPLSNIIISFIFSILYCYFSKYENTSIIMNNFIYFCWIGAYSEFVIGIFNLIPVPPLDGSKIFEYIVPKVKPIYCNMGNNGLFALFLILCVFEPINNMLWESGVVFVNAVSYLYYSITALIH